MNESRAAQQYFDPPDPQEYTYNATVEIAIKATSDDDAYEVVNQLMGAASHSGLVVEWYLDDCARMDDEEEPPEVGE